jgi:hypothetical protein
MRQQAESVLELLKAGWNKEQVLKSLYCRDHFPRQFWPLLPKNSNVMLV